MISCINYPSRKTFSEFLKRFGILAPEALKGTYDEKDACKKILGKAGLGSCQIGKTKVFLRASEMMELEAKRLQKLSSAAKIIQGQIKTRTARRDFLALQRAAISIQSSCRGLNL
nr:myosin-9-like isoform X1 [Ipomoea batatas]GMD71104.1 myosin-9-like isoform X1 [Ipomoea batatas]